MPRVSKNANFSEKGIKNARLATLPFFIARVSVRARARLSPQLTRGRGAQAQCAAPSGAAQPWLPTWHF